jgi:predicted MPP superfamily phosphohydrolase
VAPAWRRPLTGLAALAAGGLAVRGLVERHAYVLRRVTVPVLAPGQRAWRILHLSDLHLCRRDRRLAAFVQGLADTHPDLVVSTGDNVAEARALPLLGEALAPLGRYPGVFVFGSNDFYRAHLKSPLAYFTGRRRPPRDEDRLPTAALRDLLQSFGWRSAEEQRFVVDVAGQPVEVRGTGDAHLDYDDYGAVAGPPDPAAGLALGVTHAPYSRVLDAMAGDGVSLILAGHTHGGQVCLPGGGALTVNCDLDVRRAKGLSWWETGDRTAALHVSAGLGTSPYAPFRLFCRPEATLLILIPRAGR